MIIQREVVSKLPTRYGTFRVYAYEDEKKDVHLALVHGSVSPNKKTIVRIHSECLTGDAFGSARCDCGEQLDKALEIVAERSGVLLYLRQEGRGIGLINKLKAYNLQDKGLDTVEANEQLGFGADLRDYKLAAHILKDLGVKNICLITNNPHKIKGLEKEGIRVMERIPLVIEPTSTNKRYLETKKSKMGHLMEG